MSDEFDLETWTKAPWADVRALLLQNWQVTETLLPNRHEPTKHLVDLADEVADANGTLEELLRAVAISQATPVPAGLEEKWLLCCSARLSQAALSALGPDRADAVIRRAWQRYDAPEHADYRFQAGPPVLAALGPFLAPGTVDWVLTQLEGVDWFSEAGRWLKEGEQVAFLLPFLRARRDAASGTPRDTWGQVLRTLLVSQLRSGQTPGPEWDALLEPAIVANRVYDDQKLTLLLLNALSPARAEAVLAEAPWARPSDALRFLRADLSPGLLRRLADTVISLQGDKAQKDTLLVTDLKPLGDAFGPVLQEALHASAKISVQLKKALQRNLAAHVFSALDFTPAPKKKKKG